MDETEANVVFQISAQCHFCNAPAVKLCDYTIGFASDTGTVGLKNINKRITCSRPLCDECATQKGIIYFPEGPETIDFCPDHLGRDEPINPEPLKLLIAKKRRLQFKRV